MKIALVPFQSSTGDACGNAKRFLHWADKAILAGASLIVFPELALVGAPPSDLLQYPFVIEAQNKALTELKRKSRHLTLVTGGILADRHIAPRLKNAIYAFHNGQRLVQTKSELTSRGLLDETRYFAAGKEQFQLKMGRLRFAFRQSSAEWFLPGQNELPENLRTTLDKEADYWIFLSALPFEIGSYERRKAVFCELAKQYRKVILEVNLTGGVGEALFDGSTLVVSRSGRVRQEAPRFAETLLIFDTADDDPVSPKSEITDPWMEIQKALVMGLRDFANTHGKKRALIDLTGGLAHAVAARLAQEALGENNVIAALVANQQEDDERILAAKRLADRWGIETLFVDLGELARNQERLLRKTLGVKSEKPKAGGLSDAILRSLADHYGALYVSGATKTDLAFAGAEPPTGLLADISPLADVTRESLAELARVMIPNTEERRLIAELGEAYPPKERLSEAWLQKLVEDKELHGAGIIKPTAALNAFWLGEQWRHRYPHGFRISHAAFDRGWRMPVVRPQAFGK